MKLMGLWFLMSGLLNLINSVSLAATTYVWLHNNPHSSDIGFFTAGMRSTGETTPEEMAEHARIVMQWCQSHGQIIFACLQIIGALYLCRGGKMIVQVLLGKNEKAQHPAGGDAQ
jgi:hypothetical protein